MLSICPLATARPRRALSSSLPMGFSVMARRISAAISPAAFHRVHAGRTVVETVLGHRLDVGQLSHIPEDVIG